MYIFLTPFRFSSPYAFFVFHISLQTHCLFFYLALCLPLLQFITFIFVPSNSFLFHIFLPFFNWSFPLPPLFHSHYFSPLFHFAPFSSLVSFYFFYIHHFLLSFCFALLLSSLALRKGWRHSRVEGWLLMSLVTTSHKVCRVNLLKDSQEIGKEREIVLCLKKRTENLKQFVWIKTFKHNIPNKLSPLKLLPMFSPLIRLSIGSLRSRLTRKYFS